MQWQHTWDTGNAQDVRVLDGEGIQQDLGLVGINHSHLAGVMGRGANPDQGRQLVLAAIADRLLLFLNKKKSRNVKL